MGHTVEKKHYESLRAKDEAWIKAHTKKKKKRQVPTYQKKKKRKKIRKVPERYRSSKLQECIKRRVNELISHATDAENHVKAVLDKLGVDYIFQYPITASDKKLRIVDFYLPKYRMIIEVDGGYHKRPSQMEKDKERDHIMRSFGYRVFRVTNEDAEEMNQNFLRILYECYDIPIHEINFL